MSGLKSRNIDIQVVDGFGDEWSRFDQSELSKAELQTMWENYFNIFPWPLIGTGAVGFDLGCGSGRWARFVAPRVGKLHLIDASSAALSVARRNLASHPNCEFHVASVDAIPLEPGSADFGYSLGVLHHVPNTQEGIEKCVSILKPGAPFLLYLYYSFDNRPAWFRLIWKVSDIIRKGVSALPHSLRWLVSEVLAIAVYWPLARLCLILEKAGIDVSSFPLSWYRNHSLYVMRNDALDRFGTRLEQRFSRAQIQEMMQRAGLENIIFSETSFWTAIGYKRR